MGNNNKKTIRTISIILGCISILLIIITTAMKLTKHKTTDLYGKEIVESNSAPTPVILWDTLGGGVSMDVRCFGVYKEELYATGSDSKNRDKWMGSNLVKWDGKEWKKCDVVIGEIYDM